MQDIKKANDMSELNLSKDLTRNKINKRHRICVLNLK